MTELSELIKISSKISYKTKYDDTLTRNLIVEEHNFNKLTTNQWIRDDGKTFNLQEMHAILQKLTRRDTIIRMEGEEGVYDKEFLHTIRSISKNRYVPLVFKPI